MTVTCHMTGSSVPGGGGGGVARRLLLSDVPHQVFTLRDRLLLKTGVGVAALGVWTVGPQRSAGFRRGPQLCEPCGPGAAQPSGHWLG